MFEKCEKLTDGCTEQHYDFHHFILNRTTGYNSTPLFPYSSEPTKATPQHLLASSNNTPEPTTTQPTQDSQPYLTTASTRQAALEARIPDSELEGYTSDPSLTKVVDRRWYERNKHIYPASLWEEFDPEKDYAAGAPRKDGLGNSYFFSR